MELSNTTTSVPLTGSISTGSVYTTAYRPKFCSECGRKLEADWNNCPGCGRMIVAQWPWPSYPYTWTIPYYQPTITLAGCTFAGSAT